MEIKKETIRIKTVGDLRDLDSNFAYAAHENHLAYVVQHLDNKRHSRLFQLDFITGTLSDVTHELSRIIGATRTVHMYMHSMHFNHDASIALHPDIIHMHKMFDLAKKCLARRKDSMPLAVFEPTINLLAEIGIQTDAPQKKANTETVNSTAYNTKNPKAATSEEDLVAVLDEVPPAKYNKGQVSYRTPETEKELQEKIDKEPVLMKIIVENVVDKNSPYNKVETSVTTHGEAHQILGLSGNVLFAGNGKEFETSYDQNTFPHMKTNEKIFSLVNIPVANLNDYKITVKFRRITISDYQGVFAFANFMQNN